MHRNIKSKDFSNYHKMKVAITSRGNSPDAKLDSHFGRCSFFVFYDSTTQGIEFLPNPYKESEEGSGKAAVELIASRGVAKIVSGEIGIRIKPLLDSLKIQMIIFRNTEKSIQDIINLLNH
jgi:predicted Fe-Mo cluster-binding NifX family protein